MPMRGLHDGGNCIVVDIAAEVGGLIDFYTQVGLYFADDLSGVVEREVGVLYTWLFEPKELIVKVEQM